MQVRNSGTCLPNQPTGGEGIRRIWDVEKLRRKAKEKRKEK
jgi:hypothetical protein